VVTQTPWDCHTLKTACLEIILPLKPIGTQKTSSPVENPWNTPKRQFKGAPWKPLGKLLSGGSATIECCVSGGFLLIVHTLVLPRVVNMPFLVNILNEILVSTSALSI